MSQNWKSLHQRDINSLQSKKPLSWYLEQELKIAHMVSINLCPHVIPAWYSYCCKESARPRTSELYLWELVIFFGKEAPQFPDINLEIFCKIFYVPLMKSMQKSMCRLVFSFEQQTRSSNNLFGKIMLWKCRRWKMDLYLEQKCQRFQLSQKVSTIFERKSCELKMSSTLFVTV